MTWTYVHNSLANKRALKIQEGTSVGPVVYWINRDQRIQDNHAFSFAQSLALTQKQPLVVYFGFDVKQRKYNKRQIHFLLSGLHQVHNDLKKLHIPFILQQGTITKKLIQTVNKLSASSIITDFSPLLNDRQALDELKHQFKKDIYLVDAHNIVPCWVASDKQEYAAYTIRSKLKRLFKEYQQPPPAVQKHPYKNKYSLPEIDWIKYINNTPNSSDYSFQAGERQALNSLNDFVKKRLSGYADLRNDPTKNNQSDLSPYLHFGQISSRTILDTVRMSQAPFASIEQFEDELFIRKELSDNFCYYCDKYDTVESFPRWAKETLQLHITDQRQYVYTQEQFETAATHDRLWNAAQLQMTTTGKMHGYMRMYWAKKILEWTKSPQEAMRIAIYLNDTYQLDGNDPNGYAGIAWSIGGVHDRAWFERDIFGKVRYMNENGCKRKFNIQVYINSNSKQHSLEIK